MEQEEKLKEGDWIEIDFTGRVKDTEEIFDSSIKEDLEKAGYDERAKSSAKPFIFCLGKGMFLKSIDDFLIGKPLKKENEKFTIELPPEKAFGKRYSEKIQVMPQYVFKNQQVKPYPGAMFNFDGKIGKVIAVSGGRVRVDFNHPVAGKDVVYEIIVKRKVEDLKEKINAFNLFLFKKKIDFDIDENKDKIVFNFSSDNSLKQEQKTQIKKIIESFKPKYKELFGMDVETSVEKKR